MDGDEISDSQWHDYGQNYLTNSQFEDIFTDWSQGDSFSQSDNVEGWSQGDSFSQSDNVVDMDCSESDSSGRKRKSSELPRYNKG